ncbi:MAG: hypothetical protein AABM29_05545 [Actinomycetota bacterium]
MTPPKDPQEPQKPRRRLRRDERRDDLSARLGRAGGSRRQKRQRLVDQEREAYREARGERKPGDPRATTSREGSRLPKIGRPKLSRPKLRRPKLRRPKLAAVRPSLRGMLRASVSGLRATAERAGPATKDAAHALGRGAAWVAVLLLRLFALAERLLAAVFSAATVATARTVAFLERQVSPERALLGVTGGAAACLALSQFVAYRGVDVGRPDYAEVSNVAPPPQTALSDAGAAHAYVLVPLAALALVIALLAVTRRRWRLGRLVAGVGLVGILISLAIDLPKGLDAGTAGVAFAGAKATMKEGFYVQLASSLTLVVCGLLLGRYIRGAQRTARSPSPKLRPRPRQAPSVARGGA